MPSEISAASQASANNAQASDGKDSGSGNLSAGQAAAQLFARQPAPAAIATEETAPVADAPEQTTDSAAEEPAQAASATESEETETPPEETQDDATETEGEDDNVLSPKSSLDAKTKERIQKRIDKEVGRRKALEARNAEMEGRLAQLESAIQQKEQEKSAPPPPVPSDIPLGHISDINQLGQLQKQAKEAIRWAEEQLDRDDIADGIKVGDEIYDRSKLKATIRNARITLEDHIPVRAQFLNERERTRQIAHQELPFLKDRSTPEYQQAQTLLRDPWIQQNPNADWFVGVYMEGLKAIEAKKAAAKTKAEEAKKPKPVVAKPSTDQTAVSSSTTATRAPAQSVARQQVAAEQQKISEKGGVTAQEAAAFLMKKERLRTSR